MTSPEIDKLREYLESGRIELKLEEKKLDEFIEKHTTSFLSRHDKNSINDSMINDFKDGLRNIYVGKLDQKRALLDEVSKKIDRLENEYLKACA